MEGCPNKFVDLVDCCLGRRKKEEPIEPTPPRRNTYGQKLKKTLDNKARRDGAMSSKAHVSRPLPLNPPGRASLDLGKARRPSGDLSDLVGSDNEDASIPHKYDRAWYEMLSSLHNALRHTKYSISGRMGMSVWGCSIGAKNGLSIVCPIESRQAVKIWCISTSGRFSLTESEPDVLVFQSPDTPQSPSRTWRIRIRWLREATFEAMPKVEMALRYDDGNPYAGEQIAEVNVLTLPALLDNCASAWVEHVRKHDGKVDGRRLRGIEEDIFSLLERIMDLNFTEEGSGPLTHQECRHVARDDFWAPFTKKHKDSPAMFALCGMPLPKPPTTVQPGPNAGMIYPEDRRFSNPRPAPAVRPKDKGRDLTANIKRQSDPEPKSQRRVTFMDLFGSSGRKEAKDAERERWHTKDAKRLEEQVRRGARRLDESERERRSHPQPRHGKGKEREGSRRRGGDSRDRPGLKKVSSRVTDDGDHRRDSTPRSSMPWSSRHTGSAPGSARDGTKVSSFDPSSLERSASGNGRIPRRGHFADLFILDDGEAL